MKKLRLPLVLAVCFLASPAFGEPVQPSSPLDTVRTLRGAAEVKTQGRALVVVIQADDGTGDHLFQVETASLTGLPIALRTNSAEILFWRGHLVVMASREGKALHFSIPGIELQARAAAVPRSAQVDVAGIDKLLRSRFHLTRVDATGIVSREGPLALRTGDEAGLRGIFANDDDVQDPGTGGGLGSCGSSCSTTCGDGSSCSATCSSPRCAHCSCPASCSCS